jgi:hypothetical protein
MEPDDLPYRRGSVGGIQIKAVTANATTASTLRQDAQTNSIPSFIISLAVKPEKFSRVATSTQASPSWA